jgi:catechol 2,3-dioxygenase-like lactoylglutathione lyase family enzyme
MGLPRSRNLETRFVSDCRERGSPFSDRRKSFQIVAILEKRHEREADIFQLRGRTIGRAPEDEAAMITKLSHVTLFVNNQDEAKKFYVDTLGFEVRTDHTMDGGFRWLTVGPKTQKDVEIVLMEPKPGPMLDEEAAKAVRLLLKKGVLGSGVFEVDDCRKTYEELKSRGVQFAGPPEERFYGIEAIMRDGQGNWFSMTQHKDH